MYQHVLVDNGQPKWADAIKDPKELNVELLFEWKASHLEEDGWGEYVYSPMMNNKGQPLKDENGETIMT